MTNILDYIDKMQEMYEGKPSSTVPGPRNMFADGQLVRPNDDGSRPGYAGVTGKTKKKTLSKEKLNVLNKYSREIFGQDYEKLTKPDEVSKVYNTAVNRSRGADTLKYVPTSETNRASLPKNEKNKLIKFAEANNIKLDFKKYPRFGVARSIKGKPGNSPVYQKIFDSYKNYGFEIFKKDTLPLKERNFVMDNFELPKGVKNWNFDEFKFGVNSTKYRQLQKRIENKLAGPVKYTIAVDRNAPKGWMTAAMERVYKNQTTLLEDGSRVLKKGVDKLTYEPVFKEGTNNIIIGFKDNTPSGQGLTYYGLNKNTPEGAASWSQHKDYNKVAKFIDITERVKEEPSKILQKILDDKGITKLMGDKSVLTLNDILSHERYYNKISETKPTKLLERQIVKHHIGGVGAGDVARANATKDIQLLSGAVNKKITGFESKLIKDGFLSKADNDILKNLGAKIRGTDGKIYGGGYTDPTKQFEAIEKKALEYAKGDQFNVKTVASYLERLGCGKAAGGRILMSNGGATLTKCAIAGQKKLNLGLTNGFDKTEGELAKKILQAGRGLGSAFALRNILGPAAVGFTVAAEAGLVGYDMLATGKSFKEAVGASLFNYALGDKTQIDNKKLRYQGYADAGVSANQIGKISAFESAMDEMNNTFAEFDKENRLFNIAANQKGSGRMSEQRYKELKQKQAENFYNQVDKNKALIQDLARTQTESRLDKALDPMVPALMSDADAKRKAMQLTKPRTVAFGNFMDTAFPRGFLSDTTYKEDRDKAINYMPEVQEYYRGNRFARGGLSGGDTSGRPPESGPMSQGLRSLYKNGRKL